MNAIYDWDSLDIYDLFGHLSNYDFNYHKLVSLSRLSEYEIALPLLQEVNMCLKEEVKLGNLTETEYQLFIDDVLDGLMQHGNDDYLRFIEADRKNESIDDFKLHFKKGL